MAANVETMKQKLEKALEPIHLEIQDDSNGCGMLINVTVVSEKFDGLSLLKRHRLVNDILKEEIKLVHAFSQKSYTPKQWEEMNPPQDQQPTEAGSGETAAAAQ